MTSGGFNGNIFDENPDILKVVPDLEDLFNLPGTLTTSILEADILKDGLVNIAGSDTVLNNFFQTFVEPSGSVANFPRSLDQFASQLVSYLGSIGVSTTKTDIKAVFTEAYYGHLGLDAAGVPSDTLSPALPLQTVEEGQTMVDLVNGSNLPGFPDLAQQAENFFDDLFGKFPFHVDETLHTISIGFNGTPPNEVGSNNFHAFLQSVTRGFERVATFALDRYRELGLLLKSKFPGLFGNPILTDTNFVTYKDVFEAFVSDDPAEYDEALLVYYQEILGKTGNGDPSKGYFNPSLAFEGWVRTVYNLSEDGEMALVISDDATKRTIVLDRILRLIISMIDVIQQISIAQAERLTFLSKWQKAYTQIINQIPLISKDDGTPFANNDEQRTNFNTKANRLIEIVRARRQVIVDDSKSHQSSVNQSSDAVTQQVNVGTSILQQLSTLIGAIFR